jgi:hypothetical protein
VTGNLLGTVVDPSGIPQMGATVQLFDKYDRPAGKTFTAADGRFGFTGLAVDSYSVRVTLASFFPAFRDRIAIKAGLDSMLRVHLATLLSNIEVAYTVPMGAMTDDWKWVLRSSPSTRPVTRFLPVGLSTSAEKKMRPRIFSDTHAMLSVAGGDNGTLADADAGQADLGTGFALSTNIWGKNQVQVSGTFGQGTGTILSPAVALCAVYSREQDGEGLNNAPEVTLTMRQFAVTGGQNYVPDVPAQGAPLPIVRDVAMSIYQIADPVDNVHIEYGAIGESLTTLEHTARLTPFARVTVNLGAVGEVIATYSNGGRPDPLYAHQAGHADEFDTGVGNLTRLPQLSSRNGRLELQRTQNYEIGYQKTEGTRTYAVSAFYEDVSDGRVSVAGDISALAEEDLLSDGTSKGSVYNIGRYSRRGVLASADQRISDSLDVAVAYGRMGGFTANPGGVVSGSSQFLAEDDHNLATVNVRAKAPVAGTQIVANYGWVGDGAIVPRRIFSTQNTYAEPGLNITVKQPLPSFFGMPGHFEIVADVRNILAQGYLPMDATDNRTLLVVQAPRAIRGGLNFIF